MTDTTPAVVLRIKARCVVNDGGCWIWRKPSGVGYGYTRKSDDGIGEQLVHRVTWEAYHGPVPAGLELDHYRCDTRACANPDHVRPVTHRENILRGPGFASDNASKWECPKGHPYDDANTYVSPAGSRICRECNRIRSSRNYARKRALRLGVDSGET